MISYLALLDVCKQINDSARSKKQQRNVSVIQDIDGNNIGDDLPSEYSGSKYTHSIKGTNAKAKANAVQGIPEMIEITVGKHFREIRRASIGEMQCMAGIVMIQDLQFRYIEMMKRWRGITFFMLR